MDRDGKNSMGGSRIYYFLRDELNLEDMGSWVVMCLIRVKKQT